MSDTDTSPDSVQSTQLGQAIAGALGQSQQDKAALRSSALSFPGQISAIREQEHKDVSALGAAPRLTPEQMRQYSGPPPTPKPTSIVEEWGSPAMLLALLGSAFTRQPLTNALNAGAAVMRAYQTRDFDAAKQSIDQWKEANDTALKLYDVQSKAYANDIKAIREGTGDQIKDAANNLHALALAFKDNSTAELIQAGRLDLAVDSYDKQNAARDQLKTKGEMIDKEAKARLKLYDTAKGLATAKTALDTAQKTNNPEASAAAQTAYTTAKEHYDAAEQDVKILHDVEQTGKTAAQTKFGSIDDLMQRWHQDFTTTNKREPTTEEIAAQRAKVTAEQKPPGRAGAAQIQRLVGAMNEAVASLGNLSELPIGSTAGWFQGLQNESADSLGGAIQRSWANKLTPQDAQDVAVTFTGLQRTLAVIDAQGSAYGVVGLSKLMQSLMPRVGDTTVTVMRKYAEMRQILDQAIESVDSNPETAPPQKALLEQIRNKVSGAVPWTIHDVMDLEKHQEHSGIFGGESIPEESAKEFATKAIKRFNTARGVTTTTQDERAVPAALKSHEDGEAYRDPKRDGGLWVKHGDKLIWTPGAVPTQ
jgi:hypothetical protein